MRITKAAFCTSPSAGHVIFDEHERPQKRAPRRASTGRTRNFLPQAGLPHTIGTVFFCGILQGDIRVSIAPVDGFTDRRVHLLPHVTTRSATWSPTSVWAARIELAWICFQSSCVARSPNPVASSEDRESNSNCPYPKRGCYQKHFPLVDNLGIAPSPPRLQGGASTWLACCP